MLLGTDQVSDGLPSMAPDVQDCAQVVEMQVTTDDAAAAVASAPLQSGTEQIGTVVPELQSAGKVFLSAGVKSNPLCKQVYSYGACIGGHGSAAVSIAFNKNPMAFSTDASIFQYIHNLVLP